LAESLYNIRNKFRMVFINFSEFSYTVIAIKPVMTFNIIFDERSTIGKVLDSWQLLESELLNINRLMRLHENKI